MKKIVSIIIAGLFVIGMLLVQELQAQAPSKMSYQTLVRNASNAFVTNQQIGMQISILKGSATGTSTYVETHTPTSNAGGLVSLDIGTGTVVSGDFSTIDWSGDSYFLKTEVDLAGGTNYTITGTSQLLSVPYALYAKSAGNTFSGSYNDLTDVPASSGSGFDGKFTSLTDVPDGLSDGDADTQLTESQVDAFVANNGYLSAEVDGSITNETNTSVVLNGTDLEITDGAGKITTDLSSLKTTEVDGSVTNEINTSVVLDGTDLKVTDSGGTITTDLSSLATIALEHQLFTASGTFTVPSNVNSIRVTLIGGGGSGGSRGPGGEVGAGGEAGNYVSNQIVAVTPGASLTITVGAGGTPATCSIPWTNGCPGNQGGTSSVAALVSATGGAGGCGSCIPETDDKSGKTGPFGTFGGGSDGIDAFQVPSTAGADGMVLIEYYFW